MARRAQRAGDEPAPIGHNQPEEPIKADLGFDGDAWAEYMARVFAGATVRLDELLAMDARFKDGYPLKAGRTLDDPPIGIEKWDDDVQGRCASMREKFRDVLKLIENLHEIEKAPILTAGRAVDGAKNALAQKIGIWDSKKKLVRGADAPLNRIADRCTVYAEWVERQLREAARKEAAEVQARADAAARKAAQTMDPDALDDAAAAAVDADEARAVAAAPVADLTRVHGAAGGTISLRTTWSFIEDESDLMALAKAVVAGEAPLKYLAFNSSAIGYAVRSEKVREIPGCKISEVRSV
jgi:hypothetical protein